MKVFLENNHNEKLTDLGHISNRTLGIISTLKVQELAFKDINNEPCLFIQTDKPAELSGSWIVQEI